jgi:hypothetical protein
MKTGSTFLVSGYSNDVGNEITVKDPAMGPIELEWRKIEKIEFMDTPSSVDPDAFRIRGKVISDAGDFEGYIMWDKEECLSSDKLDGDSEDGRVSIMMGAIDAIERRSRNSSRVILKDGRELNLSGTNDVNGSIRGIMVEDKRFGRVTIPWVAFEKADLYDEGDSGPGYKDYKPKGRLEGSVKSLDGDEFNGLIVFDLDEAESWEILNGDRFDVEYDIPFEMVKSIRPRSSSSSTVKLTSGEEIRLEDSQDISDRNDGVLVFKNEDDDDPVFLEWDEIEELKLKK